MTSDEYKNRGVIRGRSGAKKAMEAEKELEKSTQGQIDRIRFDMG